jgi:hypothetical protein
MTKYTKYFDFLVFGLFKDRKNRDMLHMFRVKTKMKMCMQNKR